MERYEQTTARGIIGGINGWDIQAIKPSAGLRHAWDVTLGSTPRTVGDLLPDYEEGSEEGVVLPLQPREGTAEFDETVELRRPPVRSPEGDVETPGIVMWGMLTCAYASRDPGTFEGTIAFYEDEDQGAALMHTAETAVAGLVLSGALDEIDGAIGRMEGLGQHMAGHARRIIGQSEELRAFLAQSERLDALLPATPVRTMAGRERLEAENAQLRAALLPFAEAAGSFRADDADTMRPASVQARHYRRAADLLGLPAVRCRTAD